MNMRTIAITVGDPAGIGPEISLKAVRAVADRLAGKEFRLLLVGNAESLAATGRKLGLPVPAVVPADGIAGAPDAAILATSLLREPVEAGKVSGEGGRQAFEAVRMAVEQATAGTVAAIVTAPLNKEALHLGGHDYAGHTEMLADLTGARDSVMMLAHGNFRVSHVSTHCALEDVPRRATPERIRRVVDLTREALQSLGMEAPRIAIAALNPHAGEGGIFGRHDIDVTAPLAAAYQARGMRVDGPVSGDTVFVKLRAGQYDAVVAMYHDQGHIPVKLLGFGIDRKTGEWTELSGVNVTLGLPIIRTSVDHGTAFDIAGRGIAQASSLLEAIDYALQLAGSSDRKAPAAA
ncbi:MAG: 4-hydroxythreonine-4-phosphate dehydrogenase PdxA [Parvibaculaceae bacterium]